MFTDVREYCVLVVLKTMEFFKTNLKIVYWYISDPIRKRRVLYSAIPGYTVR